MGLFSWMYADTNNTEALKVGGKFYLALPEGGYLYDGYYDGYGRCLDEDIYELVAIWNREYLSKNPDFIVNECKVSEMAWYPEYADLTLSVEEVEQSAGLEFREIGIDLSCENNPNIPYPIKICKYKPENYESLCASIEDPNQGC